MLLKIKKIIVFLTLFSFIICINDSSMIIFPFKIIYLSFLNGYRKDENNFISNNHTLKNIYNSSRFIDENYILSFVTPIKIGEPAQEIISYINIYNDNLLLGELKDIHEKIFPDSFYKGYHYDKSFSFRNITSEKIFTDESQISIGEEKIYFYTNINDIKKSKYTCFSNFQFKFENQIVDDKNNSLFGMNIGLILSNDDLKTNFMKQLNDKNIISKYVISFEFTNDDEGMLFIGKLPHEFLPNKYSEKQYKSFYSYQPRTMYMTNFVIIFDEIYSKINNEKISLNKIKSSLSINLGLIIGTHEYMKFIENNFFNQYIKSNYCEKYSTNTKSLDNFIVFSCHETNKIKFEDFPTLYFIIKSVNLTFEFNYSNLFKKIDNKYYFMIIFHKYDSGIWILGKPFIYKYTFTYDGDAKTIGFYQMNNEYLNRDKNYKNFKIELNYRKIVLILILFLIFIFLIIIIAYYFGKKYNLIRKKLANELDDDYEYGSTFSTSINSKDINFKDSNEFKQQHLELIDESKLNL